MRSKNFYQELMASSLCMTWLTEILLRMWGNGCTKLRGILYNNLSSLTFYSFRFANAGVCKILVGNKCDAEESRKVSHEEGMELAKHYEIPFLETSAKNSINVDNSFITMSNEIKRNIQNKASAATTTQGDKKAIVFGRGILQQQSSGSEETTDTSNGSIGKKKNQNCCQWARRKYSSMLRDNISLAILKAICP